MLNVALLGPASWGVNTTETVQLPCPAKEPLHVVLAIENSRAFEPEMENPGVLRVAEPGFVSVTV